ncbi:winged helix-turn-helix transcriptional regulator [Nocardia sp. NPDC052566]|uniref:winged helix-turn-helix transcriptional regulator n=1 Tax=Nocardia sp. NPDC052566 TaxID=3364330 RepID=UPI0037CBF507
MRYEELSAIPCTITRPLVIFGDRWTLLVLKFSFSGVRRFNKFQDALGISRSRLQDRLDRLLEHGILEKRKQADSAYEEYHLTPKGYDIYPILMAIKNWGDEYTPSDGPVVHSMHRDCGGEVHVHLECDSCAAHLTASEIVPEIRPGKKAAG